MLEPQPRSMSSPSQKVSSPCPTPLHARYLNFREMAIWASMLWQEGLLAGDQHVPSRGHADQNAVRPEIRVLLPQHPPGKG